MEIGQLLGSLPLDARCQHHTNEISDSYSAEYVFSASYGRVAKKELRQHRFAAARADAKKSRRELPSPKPESFQQTSTSPVPHFTSIHICIFTCIHSDQSKGEFTFTPPSKKLKYAASKMDRRYFQTLNFLTLPPSVLRA